MIHNLSRERGKEMNAKYYLMTMISIYRPKQSYNFLGNKKKETKHSTSLSTLFVGDRVCTVDFVIGFLTAFVLRSLIACGYDLLPFLCGRLYRTRENFHFHSALWLALPLLNLKNCHRFRSRLCHLICFFPSSLSLLLCRLV